MSQALSGLPARDAKVVSLIGVAHFFSHFLQLTLPPLFPVIKDEFGVGYAELGVVMTFFYGASGLMQTPAGFLVDRFGARTVLLVGLATISAAVALLGLAPNLWVLIVIMAVAGIGNSVFHPADYAILTASVSRARLARAYSIHTLGGNLGWAAAPVIVLPLAGALGWRFALLAVGLSGLLVAAILLAQSALIEGEARAAAPRHHSTPAPSAAILLTAPILLCFVYFTLLSASMIGVQNFLPASLHALYETPLETASKALTCYLLGASAGILAGGWIADRFRRHEVIVGIGLLGAAALILVVGMVDLGALPLSLVVGVAGFLSGTTFPSRDMLVRSATPPGSTGKVFGFVYSGLDLGAATAPPVLGLLLDHGSPRLVFVFVAVVLLATITAAVVVRRNAPAPLAAPHPAE
jgi:FSR family fosmidomycin resistance protein-like MFS transporter